MGAILVERGQTAVKLGLLLPVEVKAITQTLANRDVSELAIGDFHRQSSARR